MTPKLPDSVLVLERGWLSSNNIVFFEGETAALVDSGYVSHAAQTLALLERALDGRCLTRLINTHSHSDHIGGNAAVQASFHCHITVPEGIAATIAEWDEDALLLSPLGQRESCRHVLRIGSQPVEQRLLRLRQLPVTARLVTRHRRLLRRPQPRGLGKRLFGGGVFTHA